MSYYEPQTAKKVYLYRNGTINADAKLLVVNDRQVRDFSTFLNRATSGIRAPVAVRNIYTPMHGHKVRSLEELQSGRYYVAGGSEQFKKVKYGSGPKLLPRRQQRIEVAPPTLPTPHVIVAESRYKRPVEKPLVIHVFRNGDELFHGVRVLLPKRIVASWDHVLEIVTEKADLYTPAKRLCTLDGEVVSELQDGGRYVAVENGKTFRKVAYCVTSITAARRKRNLTLTQPIVTRRVLKPRGGRLRPSLAPPLSLFNTAPLARPQPPPVDPTATLMVPPRRKIRPMAGRRNKEARERALLENRDDSVFGGSPVMQLHPRMPSPPPSASTTHLLLRHQPHPGREPGEGRGRSPAGLHGNYKNNDVMNPPSGGGGGGSGNNKEGVVVKIAESKELEKGSKTEVTISVEDSELTLYPPLPSTVPEENLEGEISPADMGPQIPTEEQNATPEIGQIEIPNEGPQNEIPGEGISRNVSNQGSRRETPGAQIHDPPEVVQNNTPPEGTQNSAPATEVDSDVEIESSRSNLPAHSKPSSKRESRERVRSSRQLSSGQKSQEEEQVEEAEDLGRKEEGESECRISESLPNETEEEVEEVNSQIEQTNKLSETRDESQVEPDEVPEEEGVAERSEVKEEAEEPEMKLQGEELELVSEAPQTNIDLTLSRKAQEPLINANDGNKENLPLPTGETDDREEENSTGEGVTPPDSQAAPPTPLTNDDDNEHVLIVEDPPQ